MMPNLDPEDPVPTLARSDPTFCRKTFELHSAALKDMPRESSRGNCSNLLVGGLTGGGV